MYCVIMPIIFLQFMAILWLNEGFRFEDKHHYHQPATVKEHEMITSSSHVSMSRLHGILPVFLAAILFVGFFATLIIFMWGCNQRNPHDHFTYDSLRTSTGRPSSTFTTGMSGTTTNATATTTKTSDKKNRTMTTTTTTTTLTTSNTDSSNTSKTMAK
ncbi:uncharacterized protein LOC124495787 [Dermatophagoides farinae]|uniref:Uncharacterized protein n=1 Tax=Dermatophagoides farinae TaxID=6954 RepID=A0A922LCF8_DERFA|nr:hypothetical protein DERF_000413 [Dermatophagoides farinae]